MKLSTIMGLAAKLDQIALALNSDYSSVIREARHTMVSLHTINQNLYDEIARLNQQLARTKKKPNK